MHKDGDALSDERDGLTGLVAVREQRLLAHSDPVRRLVRRHNLKLEGLLRHAGQLRAMRHRGANPQV